MKNKINIDWLKRQAKKIKKEKNITHVQALELLAKQNGYNNWQELIKDNNNDNV